MPAAPSTIKDMVRATLLRLTNPRLILPSRSSTRGEIKRIVVMRPDHLGDLLFATPALDLLRMAYPQAHITGLVGPWGRAMWQDNPNLDALETVRFPGIVSAKDGGPLGPYRLLNATAKRLGKSNYDLGIVLRFDHWWGAALLAAAGVPRRWGYDTPAMAAWLTNAVPYIAGKHEVEQNLILVGAMMARTSDSVVKGKVNRVRGQPPLRPPRSEPFTGDALAGWLASERKVVIHAGTAAANKLWTISSWAEVARSLMAEGWAVSLTGSPDERRLADAIVQAIGSIPQGSILANVAGQTASLTQLLWVLERADMVLGVDSGPLHIADALGKPTLHLYGPSDETIWGPWGDPALHRAFRAPGTHATMQLDVGSPELEGGPDMRSITPKMVMQQIALLLAASL